MPCPKFSTTIDRNGRSTHQDFIRSQSNVFDQLRVGPCTATVTFPEYIMLPILQTVQHADVCGSGGCIGSDHAESDFEGGLSVFCVFCLLDCAHAELPGIRLSGVLLERMARGIDKVAQLD